MFKILAQRRGVAEKQINNQKSKIEDEKPRLSSPFLIFDLRFLFFDLFFCASAPPR
jgi:hypothetical protein